MGEGIRAIWPLLFVEDIERSTAFYRDALGFEIAGEDHAGGRAYWRRLMRGGASIMLQQAEEEDGPAKGRGRGVALYFICGDADALHAEFAARGLHLEPPTTAHYGMRQLFVPEPDGYAVCFESPVSG